MLLILTNIRWLVIFNRFQKYEVKNVQKKGFPENNFQNMKPEENLELFLNVHCALADISQKATWTSPSCVCVYTHVHMDEICVCSLFSSDYSAFPICFVLLILETEWLLFELYQQSSSSNFNFYAILSL